MKLCTLALLLVVAIFVITGCNKPSSETVDSRPASSPTQTAAAATPDEFAAARATFKKNCTVCHGEDGKGGLKTVEDKKLKVPDLTEGHALHHSNEDFVKQITKGGNGMPKFADKLTPDEINALVHFIHHDLQGK